MDTFLLIATIVIGLILLFVNIYLLALYVHPEDRGFGASLTPKVLVVIGLTLSWGQVLMVSLDISNTRGFGGGFNMDSLWTFAIYLTSLFLIILIPFALFFYDTDEQKAFRQRLTSASTYTVGTFILYALIIIITYNWFGRINLPVISEIIKADDLVDSETTSVNFAALLANPPLTKKRLMVFNAGFTVFLMAFFSIIGWVLLVFFGGMGLFAIPWDGIEAYRNRPIKRSKQEILAKKSQLQDSITELIQSGQGIEESQKDVESARGFVAKKRSEAKVNSNVNKFKASVLSIEKEFEIFSAEVNYQNINPLTYSTQLWVGLGLFAVSLIWWVQILLSLIHDKQGFPISQFLNKPLLWFEETLGTGFVSTGLLTILSVYLIIAVSKGNVKFGMKIPFFFTIHPMSPNETLMNSFLFNLWLILTTSVAMVHFLTENFAQYTRLTSSAFFFGTVVKHMEFFQFFFVNRIFETAFLAWSVLTLFCLVVCGGRRQPATKKGALLNE